MATSNNRPSGHVGERSSLTQCVIEDCLRRRLSGDPSSDDEIIGRNPELMPELGDALRRLALVQHVVQQGRAAPGSPAPPAPSLPGYQIRGEIHRGGQAVVYQAIQQSTKQRVAIKVMRADPFAGRVARARFQQEVEVLGQLRHPNIVAIHDSGTVAGDFYYVMDYIPGQPLDRYVVQAGLAPVDTLRLFAKICDGVHAAHLRGVIHRDLKPGNIRVGADGEPHILDFGLAKVAGSPEPQAMTVTGQFLGSLPWASPEQVEAAPAGIDVRTDVYSLGVMLFYLLTGRFPYAVTGTVRDVMDNILRAEPVRPRDLRRQLDGEVETIILKCLQKDRDRRYQSAGELARDIRRHLAGEPIDAKRDSLGYVFGKQLRRHKLAAATAALFCAVVTTGLVVSLTLWTQAVAQRDRALRAEQEQTRERARAEAVGEFLQGMLASVEPAKSLGREITVRDVLDEAARKLGSGTLAGQPHVEAGIRSTIGRAYHALGLYRAAEPHLRAAVELCERQLGEEHVAVATGLRSLAALLQDMGDYAEAEVLYRRALEIGRRVLGEEHPEVTSCLSDMALLSQAKGDYGEAETLLRRVLELERRALGDEHPNVATSLNNLAMLLRDRGDYVQADALLRDVLGMRRRWLGSEHPLVVQSLNNLGTVRADTGDYTAAEPLFREALRLRRKLLGDEHPDVATSLNNLAALLRHTGNSSEAETLYRTALAMRRKLLGDEHPDVAETLNNLGVLLRRQGQLTEAEAAYREALAITRGLLGDGHPKVAALLQNLAQLLKAQQRYEESEQLHRAALAARRAALGDEHPSVAESLNNLGAVLLAKGDYEAAEPLLRQALEIRRAALPAGHRLTLTTLANLGEALVGRDQCAEAEPLLRECLSAERGDSDRALAARTISLLDASLAGQACVEKVEPLLPARHEN